MDDHQESKAYLSHLHSEHHQLELLAKKIDDRFSESRDETWMKSDRPELSSMFCKLEQELCKHIAEEDEGGCIDEAVSRRPSLSCEARKLYQESDELKAALAEVKRRVDAGSLQAAKSAFRSFGLSLQLHDLHERELVQKGFNLYPM